jgi:1-aminocyclopropane-1-carboxylate synthase
VTLSNHVPPFPEAEMMLLGSPHQSQQQTSAISSRGQSVKASRDDLSMFLAGLADPYHPTDNPGGYLVMLVAENKLMWKEMALKIEAVQATNPLPEWIFAYGDTTNVDFKAAMASVFRKWIAAPVDPNYVKVQAGAGAVLAQLSYLLADPNDGALVTAPNYPVFEGDFGIYGGVKLHLVPTTASNGYTPTIADFDMAYNKSQAAGNLPKILIICQPNNPTGIIYSAETMRLMITWALEKDLHVISDEIYALSIFPGYKIVSAADIMREIHPVREDYLGDRVHIVAGLSKDWGMSGFRVGTLFSHNMKLLQALDLIGYYPMVSYYSQHALTKVFEDDKWIDWYINENQRRLWETYQALEAALSRIQVTVIPAQGGLFVWADFSSLLKDGQSEKELWLELFEDAKVMFTTGESCNAEKLGMFRIIYSWPEGGPKAMVELGDRLVQWKAKREE